MPFSTPTSDRTFMKDLVVHILTLVCCTESGMPERVYAFGASLLLRLPVVRHIMSWMGVVPADKQVMLDVLSKASGGALPEGIAGIFTGASRCNFPFHMPAIVPPPHPHPYLAFLPGWCCCLICDSGSTMTCHLS